MGFKTYTVIEAIQISQGRLKLNDMQAERRADFIEKDGDGYKVLQPVWFKVGETFGFDGELPRSAQILLEEGGATKSKGPTTSKGGKKEAGKKVERPAGLDEAERATLESRKEEINKRLEEIVADVLIKTEAEEIQALDDEETRLKAELADIETKLKPVE